MNTTLLNLVAPLLQITFHPQDYTQLISKLSGAHTFAPSTAGNVYWRNIPTYLVSRCPFCGAPYTTQLDTHSLLAGWATSPDSRDSVGWRDDPQQHCPHFTVVQTFVTLNGYVPTEVHYYRNHLDVPFVMAPFVPDDISSIAVLHSLPICKIEGVRFFGIPVFGRESLRFVPHYLALFVTYYSLKPHELRWRRQETLFHEKQGDPEYRGTALYTAAEASQYGWYDLAAWVRRGKLQWIDPTLPDLPLQDQLTNSFPYAKVEGFRRPFLVKNGKITLIL